MVQRKAGAFLNFLTLGLNSCVGIFFTPFLLRSLGQAEYGLYQLIGAFAGYMALLDLGIQGTAIRYIAKYRAENDSKGEEHFLAVILTTYSILSLILCVVSFIVYQNLGNIFAEALTPESIEKARVMFIILAASMVFTLFSKTFDGAIQGRGLFVFSGSVYLVQIILRVAAWIAVLLAGFGSTGLVVVTGITNLLILIAGAYYVIYTLRIKIRFHGKNPQLFREIFRYSFFIFLTAIVTQINLKVGHLVLGIMVGAVAVAPYAVAMQLIQIFSSIGCVIPRVFFPETTHLIVKKASNEEIAEFLVQPSRYSLILLAPITIAFGLFGKRFILLWAGPDYAAAWAMAFSIMVASTLSLTQILVNNVLKAQGRLAFQCWLYFIGALFNVIISIGAVHWFGPNYVVIGTLISMVVAQSIIMNIYYWRIGLNIMLYFRHIFRGLGIAFLVSMATGGVNYIFTSTTWLNLIICCFAFMIFYSGALWVFGFNQHEKATATSLLRRIRSF